jgi:hypothetical protein
MKLIHLLLILLILNILIILMLTTLNYYNYFNNFNNFNYFDYFNYKKNIVIDDDSIIITASTSPKRLKYIENIIDNLLNNQTLKPTYFFLNIPYIFKRTNEKYPELILNRLNYKYDKLIINRCEDLGPITKLSTTLDFINSNSIIIIVDDDILYPNDFIENLVNTLKKYDNILDKIAISNSIFYSNINKTNIDIIEGFKGICFRRNIFKNDFNDYIKKYIKYIHCYKSDDYVISRYLHDLNTPFIKSHKYFKTIEYDYGLKSDALHNQDNIDHKERYNKCKIYIDNNII